MFPGTQNKRARGHRSLFRFIKNANMNKSETFQRSQKLIFILNAQKTGGTLKCGRASSRSGVSKGWPRVHVWVSEGFYVDHNCNLEICVSCAKERKLDIFMKSDKLLFLNFNIKCKMK